ncbi:MAG: Bax inhibitor-1/YccA family protein [Alphaproteobacteria bacterium]|nr:Bax inhibitor-1/YccA family protein [Alphaproteobacteria bacterium]MBV9905562.1 Bax inhibitor-1/YccA family protein [Alphaproteobacteria bacterium]
MADYDNRALRGQTATAGLIDAGLRAYMLRVYNYMFAGLAITGFAAYGAYMAAVTTDPSAAAARLHGGIMLTAFGVQLFTGPLMWVLLFGSLGLVLFLSFRIQKMSVTTARISFLAYAGMIGLTFASLFVVYTQASIAQVFFVTAATFGAMSLYGYTTGRDLSGFGSFLFMGLIGVVIASLVNLFVQSAMITFVVSIIGVLVFTGLTAYDTQKIKNNYYEGDDTSTAGKKAIFGALQLYLDFINLFLFILRLMGNRR